jgi:hypothetical protein
MFVDSAEIEQNQILPDPVSRLNLREGAMRIAGALRPARLAGWKDLVTTA